MKRALQSVLFGLVAMALAAFVFLPGTARADVISMEEDACRDKEAGDACTIEGGGGSGACAQSTCTRNDYSQGTPPGTKEVECLICDPNAEPPAEAEDKDEGGVCALLDTRTPAAPLSLFSILIGIGLVVALRRKK